ncbi:alkaline phosphatase family protein [Frankia sp. CNm7]|uniref:Alkaline phosphatase family protein n=1 Tax=Frankia nepalensis TaxID=1836974 RepID=A0A937URT1_9ACTN|nr:alkaline phosphatase family protein [Frankia nepalensis]MBL7500764.1 alkaline phosphatase family protein [Frankia nepalensis]MBL7511748.1 alkaline phosphatase family protein [Frankia nepalensis]MBL7521332.1 alkaline phosphatase family protein [Frankia nepalensis]MBL7633164.1 alkaline phosphatase family protein [Frankia nepalensis]
MPSSERTYPVRAEAVPSQPGSRVSAGQRAAELARAVAVLTVPALEEVVDLVAWVDDGWLNVANSAGAARIPAAEPAGQWRVLRGRNPVERQDPMHGVPRAAALADPSPPNDRNSYPLAGPRLASVFADPTRSPDLVVVHSAAHYWPEQGGHLGEHGSLDAGQSRAPLLLSGAGVRARGLIARHARVVDIAPTLAALAGASMPGVEGTVLADLLDDGAASPRHAPPRYVVGLLWDGTNCNDLLALAEAGALPNVARLLARGCALTGGAVAEFPSVTLTNHTSALTGVGPGRHGILHNVYFDRAAGRQVVTNEVKAWHTACDKLRPGVRTVFEAVGAARAGALTACVNEPIDRGAGYSTFELVRALESLDGPGGMADHLPSSDDDPHTSQEWASVDPDYAWSSRVDALGLTQVLQLWESADPPVLTWWNTTGTDTGHHAGGPYSAQSRASLLDADRRLGVFLDLLDARGLTEATAILLTADHGSEGARVTCTGDWDEALRAAGVTFRDEGYGFLYLGDLDEDTAGPELAESAEATPQPRPAGA